MFIAFGLMVSACGGRVGVAANDASSGGDSGTGAADAAASATTDSAGAGDASASDSGATLRDGDVSGFPLGLYDECAITTAAFSGTANPGQTVTLTETDGKLFAAFTGFGPFARGTLDFAPAATGAASVVPGQTFGLQVACEGTSPHEVFPGILSVTAGSLTFNSSTLFMTLVGIVSVEDGGAVCPPAQMTVEVNCAQGG